MLQKGKFSIVESYKSGTIARGNNSKKNMILFVLLSAYCLMMVYICTNICKIVNSFKGTEPTQILQ